MVAEVEVTTRAGSTQTSRSEKYGMEDVLNQASEQGGERPFATCSLPSSPHSPSSICPLGIVGAISSYAYILSKRNDMLMARYIASFTGKKTVSRPSPPLACTT